METVKISSRIAAATATALESAQGYLYSPDENNDISRSSSKFSDQPKDFREGIVLGYRSVNDGFRQASRSMRRENSVPFAMIEPVIGLANGLAKTLIGIQNTLDATQQKRSEDKYK